MFNTAVIISAIVIETVFIHLASAVILHTDQDGAGKANYQRTTTSNFVKVNASNLRDHLSDAEWIHLFGGKDAEPDPRFIVVTFLPPHPRSRHRRSASYPSYVDYPDDRGFYYPTRFVGRYENPRPPSRPRSDYEYYPRTDQRRPYREQRFRRRYDDRTPYGDNGGHYLELETGTLGGRVALDLHPGAPLLDPHFMFVQRWGNRTERTRHDQWADVDNGCHFFGHNAALYMCQGIRGLFYTQNHDLFLINPLPERFQDDIGNTPHVIVKRSSMKDPTQCSSLSKYSNHHKKNMMQRNKPNTTRTKDSNENKVENYSVGNRMKWSKHRRKTDKIKSVVDGETHRRRERRSAHAPMHVETAVFLDRDLYAHMAANYPKNTERELLRFVLAMINGVQLLYYDPSLGRPINFLLKRLEILHEDPAGLQRPHDIDDFLSNFCGWQRAENPLGDADPLHWDHALILTGLDLYVVSKQGKLSNQVVGLAPVGGMCTSTSSCTVNEGRHFESVYVVAHEIGHNLGMRHDGSTADNECDPSSHLMSPTLGSGKTTWSECSRRYLQAFLDTKQSHCLLDHGSSAGPLDHSAEGSLPGERFDADQQCMLKYGQGTTHSDKQPLQEVCRDLHCQRERYTWTSHPALEGTNCGKQQWCRGGSCVDRVADDGVGRLAQRYSTSMVIDGAWSAWGPFSDCASACLYGESHSGGSYEGSAGVRLSTRRCNDPRPENGGRSCEGIDRKYQTCSAMQCMNVPQITVREFADEICTRAREVDKDLTGDSVLRSARDSMDACVVWCRKRQGGTKTRGWSLPDGSSCKNPSRENKDVIKDRGPEYTSSFCIGGVCEEFSCDKSDDRQFSIPDKYCPVSRDKMDGPFEPPVKSVVSKGKRGLSWLSAGDCHHNCVEGGTGIKVVTAKGKPKRFGIQLCYADVKNCKRLVSPFDHATAICSKYQERVRRLSGLGMQLSPTSDDADRACRVACQDERVSRRFYLVNGPSGWFPFGTDCGKGRHRAYCISGKCLEFGSDGLPDAPSPWVSDGISPLLGRRRRSADYPDGDDDDVRPSFEGRNWSFNHYNIGRAVNATDSANFFKVPFKEQWNTEPNLSHFLNNEHCEALLVRCKEEQLQFETKVLDVGCESTWLVFYKPAVGYGNTSDISVATVRGGAALSLYNVLQDVYVPLLQKDEWCASVLDLVRGLQAGLKTNVIVSGDTAVFLTVQDEYEFWAAMGKKSKTKTDRDRANAFCEILWPLSKNIGNLDTVAVLEAEEILETAQNSLDDLWRLSLNYPQDRMDRLMDAVGHSVVMNCQSRLAAVSLWGSEDPRGPLHGARNLTAKWIECCDSLTRLFWANYSVHAWIGPPHSSNYCKIFQKRIDEILEVRAIHSQMTRCLLDSGQQDMKSDSMRQHFSGIKVLQVNAYDEAEWRQAVKTFEMSMIPAEEKVADVIKSQLIAAQEKPAQMLQVFTGMLSVASRQGLRVSLQSEREVLSGALQGLVTSLGSQLGTAPPCNIPDMPPLLLNLHSCRRIEKQALDIQRVNDTLLDDLQGYGVLKNAIEELLKETRRVNKETFGTWCEEMKRDIHSKNLALEESRHVVEFDGGKLMRVTYSSGLDGLCREVRGLVALGYAVPQEIRHTTELAQKHMAHARALQQVANFHNTIGDRMVASQRPMMLNSALRLSRLIQEQRAVAWGDASVGDYIRELYSAVERLSKDNNLLTSFHVQIRDKVVELMKTDLLRQQAQWKEHVRSIKDVMRQVEERGFTNLRAWRTHWDHQLYKCLEVQYQRGIESLNQCLPDITVDLVFRQQQLQFIPQMEEIRMKYFGQLKKFLSIPMTFKGLSETGDHTIFPTMVERNSHRFGQLFIQGESLLRRLEALKSSWKPWVALGCVDLDTLCSVHLSTWEHWDREFRTCKAFSQAIAKLPSTEEKVECFRVNLSLLRADIESQSRMYWDALTSSLRGSILQDVATVESFTRESLQALLQPAGSTKDIKQSTAQHEKISKNMPQMASLLEGIQRKNTTLASWCKERVEATSQLTSSWERLTGILENHQTVIEKQVEGIKSVISSQLDNLKDEIEKFWIRWQQSVPQLEDDNLTNAEKALESLDDKVNYWGNLKEKRDTLISDCESFGLDLPNMELSVQVEADIKKQTEMWGLFKDFKSELSALSAEEWVVFRKRSYSLDDLISSWQTRLSASVEISPVRHSILRELDQYQQILPLLQYLHGDHFAARHWSQVLVLLDIPFKPLESLLVGDFLAVASTITKSATELQNIARQASSEQVVRSALGELEQWGLTAKLPLGRHLDAKSNVVTIITEYQDVLSKVGDNQCLLQSVKSSSNYEAFSDQAQIWENRLTDLDQYLSSLSQIQRKWVYLEPVFSSGTLKVEEERFSRLDRDFRYIMDSVSRDSRVVALCRIPNVRLLLENLIDQLTMCQNSLNNYLTEKRNSFPRFFFLGDEELLEIVGQSNLDSVIQRHLKKLFAGIHSVVITGTGEQRSISSIKSQDNEMVPLEKSVNINRPVEDWLTNLVTEMRSTMRSLLVRCVQSAGSSTGLLDFPAQLLCLAECISFTARCERAINDMALPGLLKKLKEQLVNYTSTGLDLNNEIGDGAEGGTGQSHLLGLKLKALIVEHIHHITIVEMLISGNVSSVQDWNWTQQLRFYLNPQGVAVIRMVNSEFVYSYEYLGNGQRLVHTSLTHKCYLTLTQAMHLGLGGNPYGPAGTGKTECVKSLGAMLGRQVLVFNCDEGIDSTAMGRILTGLARCGSWGCFDEFNRLQEATLSAVSMLLQPLQAAIKSRDDKVDLQGQEISLDPNCGIFVTLNPSGAQYGGRHKLPANLQALFRPVVMSRPHPQEIARVMLFTEGFQCARLIGDRMFELFNLASQLLSPQQHYDWGLRALKTVLGACGKALCVERGLDKKISEHRELEIAVQALRVNTLSKLTFSDCARFDVLVTDVFPGVKFTKSGLDSLYLALKLACSELNLQVIDRQISKCVELYEQMQQRMGVVLVGPSGSGKTTLVNLLKHALTIMQRTVKRHIISPKALPRQWLLGHTDADTRQWSDGVLTRTAMIVHAEPEDVWSWVVCDGDIDPEWIESLNSVLDDNRLLTLPSGWRIQFGNNVNFLFETHELTHASPATISRMGIIYLSEQDIDVKALVSNWLADRPESLANVMRTMTESYLGKAVDWVDTSGTKCVKTSKSGLVQSALSVLYEVNNKLQFCLSLFHGLGGVLVPSSREEFAKQIFEWTGEYLPDMTRPLLCYYNKSRGIADIYTTQMSMGRGVKLNESLPLVLTADVKKTIDCLEHWMQETNFQPVLLVGPPGCGKSLILKHILSEQSGSTMVTVHCNGHLNVQHVLDVIEQQCLVITGSKGKEYRPRSRRLVVFFKDLDLTQCDSRGTSMVVQLLIQMISHGGFYDDKLDWVMLRDVQIVASTSEHPVAKLTPRFTSIVRIYSLSWPGIEDLKIIYSQYLEEILNASFPNHPVWSKVNQVEKLCATILNIYEETKNNFSSMKHVHYVFTPKDLTKWCSGILRYVGDAQNQDSNWLLQVITYEANRLFRDRLADAVDRDSFDNLLKRAISSRWGDTSNILADGGHFVNMAAAHNSAGNQTLRWVSDENWRFLVEKGIVQFSRDNISLDLVMTPELGRSVAMVCRALGTPGGHLTALGRGGSCRKSAIRIASALQGSRLVAPTMGKTYGIKEFKSDLKSAMQAAALEDISVWFLLEHHALEAVGALGPLGALLGSGEVPRLFGEEIQALAAPLKDFLNGSGDRPNTPVELFMERVKRNLHVAVCLNTGSSDLRKILMGSPALYKDSTIIYMPEWGELTLRKMPKALLDKLSQSSASINSNKLSVEAPSRFIELHRSAGALATPRRLVRYAETFFRIFSKKKIEITRKQENLQAGVAKLTEARGVVAALEEDAAKQDANLKEKRLQAAQALDMISATMRSATTHRGEMLKLREETEEKNVLLIERKQAIEVELHEVEPLLLAARSAVGDIKGEALSEIRSLRAPPEVIRDILEGVLRLMGILDTSWNSMKTFLAKRGVKEDIKSFDAARITRESRHSVEKLLHNKGTSFSPRAAHRASTAAAPLAAWVTANVRYSHVLEKIRPLELEQKQLMQNLQLAEDQISELSSGLSNVDDRVAELTGQLNQYTQEAAQIELRLQNAQNTLQAAQGLVGKLHDEYLRWQSQLSVESRDLENLPTHVMLAAASVTYLPSESEDKRADLMEMWMSIIGTENVLEFSLIKFLSSEQELLHWNTEGLPSDILSIENAIFVEQCLGVPLILDPSGLALAWLQKHYSSSPAGSPRDRTVDFVSQSSPKLYHTLELAIRFGKTLVVTEVDHVDGALLPVLRAETVQQGSRKLMQAGTRLVDFNADFQLILVSRDFKQELDGLVTIVDFSTTPTGLAGQLLKQTLKQEKPELDARQRELWLLEEGLQEQRNAVNDRILQGLAGAQGDILQNQDLLESLNAAKKSHGEIETALSESKQLHQQILAECALLEPVCHIASSVYFAVKELAAANVMCQLSINAFMRLFLPAVRSEDEEFDLASVQRRLLHSTYFHVARGVFKSERLLIALHLARRLFPTLIPENEWEVLTGQAAAGFSKTDNTKAEPVPSWLSREQAQKVGIIQKTVPEFHTSLDLNNINIWKQFISSPACEKDIPVKVTDFQTVLVVQALRPDRLHSAMIRLALKLLNVLSLAPPATSLRHILGESIAQEPLLLIASPGMDPSQELRELATTSLGQGNYFEIAMGEGQESFALRKVLAAASASTGQWVCLKNVHLVTSWLSILDEHVNALHPHMDFRLWLISENFSTFPPVLAKNCMKVSYEAPEGIKSNIQRTLTSWGPDCMRPMGAEGKLKTSKPSKGGSGHGTVIVALACLHALLQERRTFIPQGWSKNYEFGEVDVWVARQIIGQCVQERRPDWFTLRGLCGILAYGGKIDNEQDNLVLQSYLEEFFNNSLFSNQWRPLGLPIKLPSSETYKDYLATIAGMINLDSPTILGLPPNIHRAWELHAASAVIGQIKGLQAINSVTTFDQAEWYRLLSPLLGLWKKLNQSSRLLQHQLSGPAPDRGDSPMEMFTHREYTQAIILVQAIHRSLSAINKIIRGTSTITDDVVAVAHSLMNNRVPESWHRLWAGPTSPVDFLRGIILRGEHAVNDSGIQLDRPIDMSLLLHPGTFISALKQHSARISGVPLDSLHLACSWSNDPPARAKAYVTVTGLIVEGGFFQASTLKPCQPDSPSNSPAPPCLLAWIAEVGIPNQETVSLPLYESSDRQTLITSLSVISSESQTYWLHAGAALYIER